MSSTTPSLDKNQLTQADLEGETMPSWASNMLKVAIAGAVLGAVMVVTLVWRQGEAKKQKDSTLSATPAGAYAIENYNNCLGTRMACANQVMEAARNFHDEAFANEVRDTLRIKAGR